MPLSPPAARKELHLRQIEVRGYQREDGLWDIEGRLVDTKTYGFDNFDRGHIGPGEPVHQMLLRLTLDDELMIMDAEAVTEESPYLVCKSVGPNFARLKGIRIGAGWRRQVQAAVGGAEGCTHLVELLGPMATTAYQTIWPVVARKREAAGETWKSKPKTIDTCHAYASDGPVVKRLWPEFYTGS